MEKYPTDCCAAYEQMRMRAMDEALFAHGRWGMALFMSRGFATWMHAWTQASPARDEDKERSARAPAANEAASLPSHVQGQMVFAMAGMVLDALRGEAA